MTETKDEVLFLKRPLTSVVVMVEEFGAEWKEAVGMLLALLKVGGIEL